MKAKKGLASQTQRAALGWKTSASSAIQPPRMNFDWHRFNPIEVKFLPIYVDLQSHF